MLLGAIVVSTGCLQVLGLGDYRNGEGGSASTETTSTGQTGTGSGPGSGGGSSACTPGQSYPCYEGMPASTEGHGMCHAGTHICNPSGVGFGACTGQQLPEPEICSTPQDEDCNGFSCGQTVWALGYPTDSILFRQDVAPAPDGSLYIAFAFASSFTMGGTVLIPTGNPSTGLAKLDPQGNVVWAKGIGSSSFHSIAADASGPVVSMSTGIVRFDAAGTQLWTASCGAKGQAGVVAIDATGAVVLGASVGDGPYDCGGGPLSAAAGWSNILLAKFSSSGAYQWADLLKTSGDLALNDMTLDAAGNVLFTGDAAGPINFGGIGQTNKGHDVLVAQFGPDGAHTWSKLFGDAGYQVGEAIGVDQFGNAVIGGYYGGAIDFGGGPLNAVGTDQQAFVAKLGSFGSYQWAHGFGGPTATQSVDAVAIDPAGNVAIAATTAGPLDLGDGMLIPANGANHTALGKFGAAGDLVWSRLLTAGMAGSTTTALRAAPGGFLDIAGEYGTNPTDFGTGPIPATTTFSTFFARLAP